MPRWLQQCALRLRFLQLTPTSPFRVPHPLTQRFLWPALLVGALNTIKVFVFGHHPRHGIGDVNRHRSPVLQLAHQFRGPLVRRYHSQYAALLQLFFLFFAVILAFPPIREANQLFGLPIFLSQRGIDLPRIVMMPSFDLADIPRRGGAGRAVWWWLDASAKQNATPIALVGVAGAFDRCRPRLVLRPATAADTQGFLVWRVQASRSSPTPEVVNAQLGLENRTSWTPRWTRER